MTIFAPLLLAAPLLVLATLVVALARHGPLGWLAALLLVLAVAWICLRASRLALRWWRSTKVAPRPQERPADRRRVPPA